MKFKVQCFFSSLLFLCLVLCGCGDIAKESDTQASPVISTESQNLKNETSDEKTETAEKTDVSLEDKKEETKTDAKSEYIFSGVEVSDYSFDGEALIKELDDYYSEAIKYFPEEVYYAETEPNPELLDLLVTENPWSAPIYTDDNFKYNYFTDYRGAYLVPFEYIGSDNVVVIPKYVMGYPVLVSDYRKISGETIISYAGAISFDSISVNGDCKVFVGYSNSIFTVNSSTVEFVYLPHAVNVIIQRPALLKDIYAPEADSLSVSIDSSNKENLKNLYFPNVTNLNSFNISDSALEVLCLPKWKVKWINYYSSKNPHFKTIICSTSGTIPANAFKDASEIENIYFTNSVRIVETKAFSECKKLKYVNLEKVRSVGTYAFSGCGLESIKLTSLVSTSEHSFENMPNLIIAELPNAVTLANYTFQKCPKLKIVIAEELEKIGGAAFAECISLEMADYPKVRTLGNNAFANDTSLAYVNFKRLKVISSDAFVNCTALREAYFDSAQKIYDRAFKGDISLRVIEIEGVETIGAYSFQDCTGLAGLKLPYLKNANNSAFEGSTAYIESENTEDGN